MRVEGGNFGGVVGCAGAGERVEELVVVGAAPAVIRDHHDRARLQVLLDDALVLAALQVFHLVGLPEQR